MSEPATTVRRALSDDHRVRIVEELRGARDGLDLQALARLVGLHENTIRWHLGVLDGAGLVESRPGPRGRPGRPRMVYRLRPGATEVVDGGGHRLLATILTGAVAALEDGECRAEEAGRTWGRYLVRRPSPLEPVTDEGAVAEVSRLLDEEGFEAEVRGTEIHMRRCPFHDLAESTPEVVCGIHRGLVSGALEELGSGLDLEGLDVFVRPDLCVARLGQRQLPELVEVRDSDPHEP